LETVFYADILVLNSKIYYNCRQPLKSGSMKIQKHRMRIKDNRTSKINFLGPGGFSNSK